MRSLHRCSRDDLHPLSVMVSSARTENLVKLASAHSYNPQLIVTERERERALEVILKQGYKSFSTKREII